MMQKNVFDARIAMDKAASKRTVLPARYIAVLRSRAMQRYGSKKPEAFPRFAAAAGKGNA